MDIVEKNIGQVSEISKISNNGSEILDQNDKTSGLIISSQRTDSRNLSSNKQDSSDHTNTQNGDLSSIKLTVSTSDQLGSNDNLDASGKPDGADLSSIKSTVPVGNQFDSNDNLHASGNSDGADLSGIKSTVPVEDQSDSNGNLDASGKPDGADLSSSKSTVPVSNQLDSNDNLHASGNPVSVELSTIRSTVSTSDQLESDDNLHASGNLDGVDLSSIKPTVTVSDKSDNNCSSILIINDKVNNLDKLCDTPDTLVFPSGKFGSYVNSNGESEEPEVRMENTGSGDISNGRTEYCLFSTDNNAGCDFSSDEPWNENFPKRKSRSSGFFSDNIWGSDFSTDTPVTCDFSSDDFSSVKVENGEDSSNQSLGDDSSSQGISGPGFLIGKPETCGFSSNKPWTADFSNEKTPMTISFDVLNEKPADSKHRNSSLDANADTSSPMTKTSNKLGTNSNLSNDDSCGTTKDSKNIDMSCEELDNAEASSNCLENSIKNCKDSDITDAFAIETSEIPSYLIETSGILGNDIRKCKTEKELNDIYVSACKYPDYESRENVDHELEVNANGNWKIEKCHQSTVCVLKRIDENAQYRFKCIYFNRGTKLDELFKNKPHDELNVSQDEILECIDSMKEDQLNFIEDPVESNDQSGFLENRMGSQEMIEDLDDNELAHKKAKERIISIVDKMLNDEFLAMAKNKENLDLTHLEVKLRENEMVENSVLDDVKNVLIYDQIFSNELGVNLENELIGSKVQDISGYLSSTETDINDLVDETTSTRIELNSFSIHQTVLNCVKIVGKTVFSVMLGVLGYVFHRSKSLVSTECATNQTIPETVTDAEFQSETNSTDVSSTSLTNSKTVSSNNLKMKTRIMNISTLFQHLSATAGTDMTAERVMKDINSQVVMDIYNGFHELRIVDYGSLDLMSKCIKGCMVTLQRTLTHSDPIVLKASELLRKKTHTLEEMRKMNEDLKELTSDAEAHLHNIDRALTGLEDYTDDFMYYKDAISKELAEFLLEDFPEIFK